MIWLVGTDWSHVIHTVRWSDPAAWLVSVGTVGALFLGFLQYRRNSQRSEQRLHTEQAKDITAWVVSNNGVNAWLAVSNQSKNPIYEVILTLVAFQGAGSIDGKGVPIDFREFLSVVPPGLYYAHTHGNSGMSFHPSAHVAFTDSYGNNWARDGKGQLKEINQSPVEYFELPRPLGWSFPLEKIPKQPKGFEAAKIPPPKLQK